MERKNKMRFSVKAYGQRFTGSIPDDSNINEVVPVLKGLLCAIGYPSEVVDTIFVDLPEYEECEDCDACQVSEHNCDPFQCEEYVELENPLLTDKPISETARVTIKYGVR